MHATRRQVRLSGHSDWVFGLVCLLGRSLPSLESYCFKKAAGHIRFLDVVLLSSHGRLSLRQVGYAITAASAVLLDGPSSTVGWTAFPAFSGSQSVLFFNIAQATTAILRAKADQPSVGARRFLLAGFLATVNAVVGHSRPVVVPHADPGTLQQQRSQ